MKYFCREDVTSVGVVLAHKGDLVEAGQRLESGGISVTLDESMLRNSGMFDVVPDTLSVTTRESDPASEEETRDWVIELRLSTTRSRLRDIEDFIRSGVAGML